MKNKGLLDKWRAKSTLRWRPMQASLELTNKCNERCTHCYLPTYEDDPKRVLGLEEWYKVLKELREAGVLYLILMGGEAMLSKHFWSILSRASEMGFTVSMITNGILINEKNVKKLSFLGLDQVSISVYSLNDSTHDRMTKVKGSLKKAIKAVELCLNQGIKVGVNCLLTKNNINEYFDLAEWCIDRKIEIKFDASVTPKLNGDLEPTLLRASEEQLKNFYKVLIEKWPNGFPRPSIENENDFICNAAKGKCAVNAYGELLPCIEIRESLGSLVNESFGSLWYSSKANKWRNFKNMDMEPEMQSEFRSYCDHCPGMASHELGDATKVAPFFKSLAKIKSEYKNKMSKEG